MTDCFCSPSWYTISQQNASMVMCMECPAGAVCFDGSCALWDNSYTCPSSGPIPGTWERNTDLTYSVTTCPDGHRLINSTLGTATGEYNHDIQQCFACRVCDEGSEFCRGAEYIVDAYKFECQPCARGAECNGHLLRTIDNLDAFGARWEADDLGLYRIRNCPTGYRMENLTGIENQECQRLVFKNNSAVHHDSKLV